MSYTVLEPESKGYTVLEPDIPFQTEAPIPDYGPGAGVIPYNPEAVAQAAAGGTDYFSKLFPTPETRRAAVLKQRDEQARAKAQELAARTQRIKEYFGPMISGTSDDPRLQAQFAEAQRLALLDVNQEAKRYEAPFSIIDVEEKPFVEPIPAGEYQRYTGLPPTAAKVGAGLQQAGAGFLEMFKDPMVLAGLGLSKQAPEFAKGIGVMFGMQMLASSPSQAAQIYQDWRKGDIEATTRGLSGLAATFYLSPKLLKHGEVIQRTPFEWLRDTYSKPATRQPTKGASYASQEPSAESVPQPEIRPRLGEEAPLRQPGQAPAASETRPETIAATLTRPSPESVQKIANPPQIGPPTETSSPVPESPATLAAQIEALKAGRKPAVLITPGEPMPEFPRNQFDTLETAAGTFIYDPTELHPTDLLSAVNENRMGTVLGYGSPNKPSGATAVLSTKNAAGTPVQQEVVSPESLPAAIAAGQRVEPGGVLELKSAERVIAERQAAVSPAGVGGDVSNMKQSIVTPPASETSLPPAAPEVKVSEPPELIRARRRLERAGQRIGGNLGSAGQGGLFAEPGQQEIFQTQPPRGGTSAVGFPAQAASPIIPGAPGTAMIQHGYLPVTLPRSGEGVASVPQIMRSLQNVLRISGSAAGDIRTGRFFQNALGIFKPHEEIIRLGAADDIPTAVHEIGHGLQKQLYGTTKASGLKTLPFEVRRELQHAGKALYGSRRPAAGYTGEGFAEFMRLWLTTDDAGKTMPRTTRFWESQVLPNYPEVARALTQSRDLLDMWRRQGAVERAKQQIQREPGRFARIAKALGQFISYQGQAESGAPIEAVSRAAAKKLGYPLPPSEDPFKIFSWKRSAAGPLVERMATENMLDIWGNPTGPSLAEALAPVRGRRNEFMLYLFARRAIERWGKGFNPGIALEDAQFIRQLYESPQFQISAQKYYRWWDGVLEYVAQADPAMVEVVRRIRQGSSDYAPLARMIDPKRAKLMAARASSNPLMRMFGSGLPVKDIFDQTFINAARLVNRAHRAMVSNAIVRTAQIEGLGHIIEEVPRDRVAHRVNFEMIRQQLEDLGLDTSKIPADELLQYYTPATTPKGIDPIIAVKQADGVHWYHVDPRLYDALEGLQTWSWKNAFPGIPALGTALDLALGAPARIFRLGTTGLRATFSLVTNPARDVQTLLVQTSVNPARVAAEYPKALKGVITEGLGGPADGYVKAFYDLGAHMGQPLGIDISHTRRVSNELFHGRILRLVKNPIDHLRQLFSITEAAPRVAELRAVAKEIGWTPGTPMTPDQAVQLALAAKRVTVDFSAAGDISRIVNQAVPFYNPAIQGFRSFARALRNHPVRATLTGAAIFTVPTLVNWWRNKDKKWYQALPWRERYLFYNVDDGTNVWQIPKPYEWGNMFSVVPEAVMDSWYRQDPEAAKRALGHIFETTNPADYPVLVKFGKEQWYNRMAFWDRPIIPRGELDLAPGQQFGPYTSRLAKALGRAFPNTLSPRRIDAAIRQFGGGTGSDLVNLLGLGPSKIDRDWEKSDLPVLGVLWRRGSYFNAQNQKVADFYDLFSPLNARLAGDEYRRGQARKFGAAQEIPPMPAGDAAAAEIGRKASAAISQMLKLANMARENAARQALYSEAGALAEEATRTMKNLQRGQ